ncbi:YqzE family protein [Thalassobacillus hwangdonensis]|uniref:YqzE family protein n=1 Tax=Thalassobacillus hwangdonensis TaxID=546108 RepID=A0ABW3L276_9BACI
MSGNDYVKFVTQELVRYMDMTKEEKTQRKHSRKNDKISKRSTRMFGIIPMALKLLWKKH